MGILARIVDRMAAFSESVEELFSGKKERRSSSPGMTVNTRLADADANARALRRLARANRIIKSASQQPWDTTTDKAANDE